MATKEDRAPRHRTGRAGSPAPALGAESSARAAAPAQLLRRVVSAPRSVAPADVLRLQRAVGNAGVARALTAAASRSPAIASVQRGVGSSTAKETFYNLTSKDADYVFTWAVDTAGGAEVHVTTELDDEVVGRATITFENRGQVEGPAEDEPYQPQHVLGRQAGKVCHLTGIYNLSLTRNGPANIFRGFGNQLIQMVENKAKQRGAYLMYLEPATSMVRKDPNTNDKEPEDPMGFYAKHGYALDATATEHNTRLTETTYADLNLEAPQMAELARKQNIAHLGKMLTKAL